MKLYGAQDVYSEGVQCAVAPKGCLDSSGSGKLERLAEVASFNKFGAPSLEGLRRWVGGMMSEAFELLPIITEKVGHDGRGRDGLGVGEKEMRKGAKVGLMLTVAR